MKVIAFTRVSSISQDEGLRQIQQIKKYCLQMGYELIEDRTISEIVSGVSDNRSGLDELSKLSKVDADLIIVSETSRLTRKNEDDYLDLLNIVRAVQKTGLDLHILGSSKTYKSDIKLTLIDVITLVIESDRNAREREQNKIRFATGKKSKLDRGGYIGHTMPYGYYNNSKGLGKIIKTDYFSINEDEAKIIRIMFDLIANQGYSVNKVAIYLNNVLGFKCSVVTTLNRIKSLVYTGTFNLMGKEINVPAIIDMETFLRAQANINVNHLYVSKGNKHYNMLKGIAKCPCGCSLYLKLNRTASVYNCLTKSFIIEKKCDNFGVNVEFLNKIVWNVTKKFINIDDFKAKTKEQKQLISMEIKSIERRKTALSADKSELNQNIENLVENIVTANKSIQPILNKKLSELVITATTIDKAIEKINIEATRTQNRLKDLVVDLLPSLVDNITDEEKHEIFRKYIYDVTYHSIDKNKGFVTICYKNKVEIIIMINNRPKQAYQLPLSFFFNPVDKIVIETKGSIPYEKKILYKIFSDSYDNSIGEEREMILALSETSKELTYDDVMAQYPIKEYLMAL